MTTALISGITVFAITLVCAIAAMSSRKKIIRVLSLTLIYIFITFVLAISIDAEARHIMIKAHDQGRLTSGYGDGVREMQSAVTSDRIFLFFGATLLYIVGLRGFKSKKDEAPRGMREK